MRFSTRYSLALQFCFFQLIATQQTCNVDDSSFEQGRARVIGSQQDFDTYLGNCSSITGNLTLGPDYQGSLNITGVTRIAALTHIAPTLGLTSIYFADTEFIDYLSIEDATNLQQVDAPKLTTVGDLIIKSDAQVNVSLPLLQTIERSMSLSGRVGSFEVPSLRNASGISIRNDEPQGTSNDAVVVSFPVLEEIGTFSLRGRGFASFSAPQLRVIHESFDSSRISDYDLEFALPGLESSNNTSVISFHAPDFSSLTRAIGTLSIGVGKPTTVSLPLLSYAEILDISGKVTDVALPNLADVFAMRINNFFLASSYDNGVLRCQNAKAAFERATSDSKSPTIPNCVGVLLCGGFECTQLKQGIDMITKIGMGVGIGAGLFVITLAIVWWWTRKRKEESLKLQQEAIELEAEAERRERRHVSAAGLHAGRRRDSGDSLPSYQEEETAERPLPTYTEEHVEPELPPPEETAASDEYPLHATDVPAYSEEPDTPAPRRDSEAPTNAARPVNDLSWLGPILSSRSIIH